MADTLCNNLLLCVCERASEWKSKGREKQREHECQWISHIEIAGKGDLKQNNQVNIMSKDIIKLLIINIQFTFIQPTKGANIDHVYIANDTACMTMVPVMHLIYTLPL